MPLEYLGVSPNASDARDFGAFNRFGMGYFNGNFPARSTTERG